VVAMAELTPTRVDPAPIPSKRGRTHTEASFEQGVEQTQATVAAPVSDFHDFPISAYEQLPRLEQTQPRLSRP